MHPFSARWFEPRRGLNYSLISASGAAPQLNDTMHQHELMTIVFIGFQKNACESLWAEERQIARG
jgi:hypothetical protein